MTKLYLRRAVWDFLLVLACAVALEYTLLNAFYIAPDLQYAPWAALGSVVLLAALFVVAFNRRSLRLGGVLYGVACVVVLIVAACVSPVDFFLDDVESNYFYFALVVVLSSTTVFVLSRNRGGTAFLFILGVFLCAFVQFFYERYELAFSLLFLVGSIALIIYKNYQTSATTSTSVRKLSFSAGFVVALVSVAAAVAAGAAIWFLVIAPLNPSALDIKLIEERRSLETIQAKGTNDVYQTPNTDLTTDQLTDGTRTTDELLLDQDGEVIQVPPEAAQPDSTAEAVEQLQSIDLNSNENVFNFLTYDEPQWWMYVVPVVVVLLIVGYFVGRRLWRNRRLAKIQELSPTQQVTTLFQFFLNKMRIVGFKCPQGQTMFEYAFKNQRTHMRYALESGVTFLQLTEANYMANFGKREMTADDASKFARFYKGFWKASRKQLGNWKYFWKSFRL